MPRGAPRDPAPVAARVTLAELGGDGDDGDETGEDGAIHEMGAMGAGVLGVQLGSLDREAWTSAPPRTSAPEEPLDAPLRAYAAPVPHAAFDPEPGEPSEPSEPSLPPPIYFVSLREWMGADADADADAEEGESPIPRSRAGFERWLRDEEAEEERLLRWLADRQAAAEASSVPGLATAPAPSASPTAPLAEAGGAEAREQDDYQSLSDSDHDATLRRAYDVAASLIGQDVGASQESAPTAPQPSAEPGDPAPRESDAPRAGEAPVRGSKAAASPPSSEAPPTSPLGDPRRSAVPTSPSGAAAAAAESPLPRTVASLLSDRPALALQPASPASAAEEHVEATRAVMLAHHVASAKEAISDHFRDGGAAEEEAEARLELPPPSESEEAAAEPLPVRDDHADAEVAPPSPPARSAEDARGDASPRSPREAERSNADASRASATPDSPPLPPPPYSPLPDSPMSPPPPLPPPLAPAPPASTPAPGTGLLAAAYPTPSEEKDSGRLSEYGGPSLLHAPHIERQEAGVAFAASPPEVHAQRASAEVDPSPPPPYHPPAQAAEEAPGEVSAPPEMPVAEPPPEPSPPQAANEGSEAHSVPVELPAAPVEPPAAPVEPPAAPVEPPSAPVEPPAAPVEPPAAPVEPTPAAPVEPPPLPPPSPHAIPEDAAPPREDVVDPHPPQEPPPPETHEAPLRTYTHKTGYLSKAPMGSTPTSLARRALRFVAPKGRPAKRWFVLSGSVLAHARAEHDAAARGLVMLKGATVDLGAPGAAHSGELRVCGAQRTYVLYADQREEVEAWYEAILNNILVATDADESGAEGGVPGFAEGLAARDGASGASSASGSPTRGSPTRGSPTRGSVGGSGRFARSPSSAAAPPAVSPPRQGSFASRLFGGSPSSRRSSPERRGGGAGSGSAGEGAWPQGYASPGGGAADPTPPPPPPPPSAPPPPAASGADVASPSSPGASIPSPSSPSAQRRREGGSASLPQPMVGVDIQRTNRETLPDGRDLPRAARYELFARLKLPVQAREQEVRPAYERARREAESAPGGGDAQAKELLAVDIAYDVLRDEGTRSLYLAVEDAKRTLSRGVRVDVVDADAGAQGTRPFTAYLGPSACTVYAQPTLWGPVLRRGYTFFELGEVQALVRGEQAEGEVWESAPQRAACLGVALRTGDMLVWQLESPRARDDLLAALALLLGGETPA